MNITLRDESLDAARYRVNCLKIALARVKWANEEEHTFANDCAIECLQDLITEYESEIQSYCDMYRDAGTGFMGAR